MAEQESPPGSDGVSFMLGRMDANMERLLAGFNDFKQTVRTDFGEVWIAIRDLRERSAQQDKAQTISDTKTATAGWLFKLLISTPGVAALLAVLAPRVT